MLKLATDLQLPNDAVTQKLAFIGRSGSGKTYAATKLAEEMLDHKAQVVILDPVGVWHGLRTASDGKHPGFDIPVFGGLHGDVPIEAGAGKLLAEVIVEKGLSAVLDVSMLRKGQRKEFVTDFAETLFYQKKSKRSPIHLFIEECQTFIPQRVMGEDARMLGAFEDMCKLGRNFGIGYTLVSQRPQAVNKDVLNQVEALFVLQLTGPQERKAIADWIVEKGLEKTLVDDLTSLEIGTAFCWSPQWLKILQKVKIAKKHTFDASATPTFNGVDVARTWAKVDLEQLKTSMASLIKVKEENDPKILKSKIIALQSDLRKAVAGKPVVQPKAPVDNHLEPLKKIMAKYRKTFERGAALLDKRKQDLDKITAFFKDAKDTFEQCFGKIERTPILKVPSVAAVGSTPRAIVVPTLTKLGQKLQRTKKIEDKNLQSKDEDARSIDSGMLEAVAIYDQLRGQATRKQIAALRGITSNGSTFATYLSTLKTEGLISVNGPVVQLTDEGRKRTAGMNITPPTDPKEMLTMWLGKVAGGSGKMLQMIFDAYPNSVTREAIGEALGIEYKGSTFATYLSNLKTNGLITVNGADVILSSDFMAPFEAAEAR